jgi:hypothetical protein
MCHVKKEESLLIMKKGENEKNNIQSRKGQLTHISKAKKNPRKSKIEKIRNVRGAYQEKGMGSGFKLCCAIFWETFSG